MSKTWIVGRLLVSGLWVVASYAAWAQSAPTVPTVPVRVGPVTGGFELDGVVQAVKQSTVSIQATGRIAQLLVKAGDRVKVGQLLATVDDRETHAGVQRSQAQAQQTDAELRNAQSQFERTRELQAKGFVSKAALDTAESQYLGAKAAREQAGASVQQSSLAQGFTRVTAPFDGWVQQTLAEAGELAVPGKPLLVLFAPLPLRAVVQVPSSRAEAARAASRIEVQVPDAQGQSQWLRPSASKALPMTDAVSQTIEWRLELPSDAATQLLPGQQLRVRFAGAPTQRTVVPSAAVLRRGELTALYVAQGQGFVLRQVRLGSDHGSAGVEVLAGLAQGERIAVDPIKAGLAGARPAP